MLLTDKIYQVVPWLIESLPKGRATATNIVCSLRKQASKWDPWLLKDDDVYRLFYLVGSKKTNPFWKEGAIYGAISTDLKQWQDLGPILQPDPASAWESGRMLAGSTYKEDGIYYLFYSAAGKDGLAICHEEIGLATSTDGLQWQRYSPEKLFLNLDERNLWYGSHKEVNFFWRDPYIVKDHKTGKYYMYICAYLPAVEPGGFGGCIGLAVADTLAGPYQILPPAAAPSVDETKAWPYEHMERPQVIYKNGKYHLFFSCWLNMMNSQWISQVGRHLLRDSSLYWYVADEITGPFEPVSDTPVVRGSKTTRMYGTNFFVVNETTEELIPYGWDYTLRELQISPSKFQVDFVRNSVEIR